MEPPAKKTRINHVSSPAKPSRFPVLNCMLCMMYILNVLTYCCVNFWKPDNLHHAYSARCCDKDFLSNTDIGQPTAQNTAYIPSAGLFEVGLQR